MAIKSVTNEEVSYVPLYGGNREDDTPLSVSITPLSRADADKYSQKTRYYQKKGAKGEWESNSLQVTKRQFLDNVVKVVNFVDCETGEEITDVMRFYNEAPHDLIEEILNVILDVSQLDEDERKNS